MAKRGRYGAVSGCAWRSRKLQSVSSAARGHLMNIWSFCADGPTYGHVTRPEMLALQRGSNHASRWTKELVKAGLLDAIDDGYFAHDWDDWNRVPVTDQDKGPVAGTGRGPVNGTGDDTGNGTGEDTDNAAPTITGTSAPPLRPKTQDPRPKTLPSEESNARDPWIEVGKRFAERYTQHTAKPVALSLHRKSFGAIWLQSGHDLGEVDTALQNFFADGYATEAAWPPALLAKQFGRYLRGPKPAASRSSGYAPPVAEEFHEEGPIPL